MTTAPSMEDLLAGVDVVDPYPLWQSLLDGGPVVAPDGTFALAHYNADSADNPPMERVLEAVRAAAAKAA